MEELKGYFSWVETKCLELIVLESDVSSLDCKISPCFRSSGKELRRKSLGPEISNNHSLYPVALLVRLGDLRVEWLVGVLAGGSWAQRASTKPLRLA